MIVPTLIPFSAVPVGGVFTPGSEEFWMKTDATTQVNLSTGVVVTGIVPTAGVTYFPNATLVL